MENLQIDENGRNVTGAVTNDVAELIKNLRVNPVTGRLLVDANVVSSNTSIGDTIPGGTAGSILFLGAGSTLAQDNANLFYDDAQNFVGLGTNTPDATLHVDGSVRFDLGSDATGDIYYRGAGGDLVRLAIGSVDEVLTVVAGIPSWEPATGGTTPNLQQVTDVGNTTTNSIIINGSVLDYNAAQQNTVFAFDGPNLASGTGNTYFGFQSGKGGVGDGITYFGYANGVNNASTNDVAAFGTANFNANTGNAVVALGSGNGISNTFDNVAFLGTFGTATADKQIVFGMDTLITPTLARFDFNGLNADRQWSLPNANGTFVLSVNGTAPNAAGNVTIVPGSGQSAIQFENEGVNLGAPGTVDELDFVGPGVNAVRAGNKVTVTIPGGGGSGDLVSESGVSSRDIAAVSGVQTIAHGLGQIPDAIELFTSYRITGGAGALFVMKGQSNGTDQACQGEISGAGTSAQVSTTSYAIYLSQGGLTNYASGVVTCDDTNIYITWTKNGAPSSETFPFSWVVEAGGGSGSLDVQENGVSVESPVDTINFVTPGGIVSTPGAGIVDVDLSALIAGFGGGGTKIATDPTAVNAPAGGATTVYTIPIPGGILGTDNAIRFEVALSNVSVDNAESMKVQVLYGGSVVAEATLNGGTDQIGSTGAFVKGFIVSNVDDQNQKGGVTFIAQADGANNVGVKSGIGSSVVDSSIVQNLEIVIDSTGGSSTCTAEAIIVEKVTAGSAGSTESNGVATRAIDAVSGVQNIPHGLGVAPSIVKLNTIAFKNQGGPSMTSSQSIYDGTNTNTIAAVWFLGSSTTGSATTDTTDAIIVNGEQTAVVTVDATNIILTWTKNGGGTSSGSNINILWEAAI